MVKSKSTLLIRMTHTETDAVVDEKAELNEAELIERSNQVIDHDRDTYLPRPSDDPKDPLNWALSLKASRDAVSSV